VTYSSVAVEHFTNPRNVGVVENANGVGRDSNPSCGDFTRISVRVVDDRVAEVRFKTFGCSAAIASASVVTTLAEGKPVAEAAALGPLDVITALGGLPPEKEGCALMAAGALRSALADAKVRR
jgi:nitrogen fixation protein NifU and related proteins